MKYNNKEYTDEEVMAKIKEYDEKKYEEYMEERRKLKFVSIMAEEDQQVLKDLILNLNKLQRFIINILTFLSISLLIIGLCYEAIILIFGVVLIIITIILQQHFIVKNIFLKKENK